MAHLKEGQIAPDFSAIDQNGEKISLSSLKGSKIILYFYPKDDTPGCTQEACNLRDNYHDLLVRGFKIIGVSSDEAKSHRKFTEKYSLPFPLIPDTDKAIIKAYGVWGLKNFLGKEYVGVHRTTFVIAEDGTIEKIFTKVQTKDHTQQILKELAV
jgi:peroxiredoxin Q/BCP